jgi:hypothetical protein
MATEYVEHVNISWLLWSGIGGLFYTVFTGGKSPLSMLRVFVTAFLLGIMGAKGAQAAGWSKPTQSFIAAIVAGFSDLIIEGTRKNIPNFINAISKRFGGGGKT